MASRNQRRRANIKKYKLPSYQEGGSVASGSVEDIIRQAFNAVGLDGNFAVEVARNESGLNPQAVGDGGHSFGLFQLYDQGLLTDFYNKGYTNPHDPTQAAQYTANYVKQSGDWGNWHGARALYASGQRPTDGSSYNDASGVSYSGGGGSPAPGSQPGQYDNFTREQWAYMAAAQMGPKPAEYTDAEWRYMALARGDQLREDYFNSGQSNLPNLPQAGNEVSSPGVSPGQDASGQIVSIPGVGTGTLFFDENGGGGIRTADGQVIGLGSSPTIQVLLANGQTATIDTLTGTIYDASGVPDPNNPGYNLPRGASGGGGGSSSSSSYNVSEVGPVAADIDRERNRINEKQVDLQNRIAETQNEIEMIRAYTDASSQNRLRGLEEQKFLYQQELNALDYELQLLEYAASVREQDISLRGQDISVIMAQLDAEMQGRGQDVTQRGQDIQAQLEGFNQQIAYWSEQRQAARDRNDATGMRDAEARMRAEMDNRNALVEREQDIALRSQDIDAALGYGQLLEDQFRQQVDFAKFTGNYQLEAHNQERLHAAQQQTARIDQFRATLDAHNQRINAAKSQAELETALSAQEQDWNEFLSDKLANPRDFPQYFHAMGRGEQFLDSLLAGKPFAGMTIGNIGDTPLVSSPYAEQAQPDRTMFWRAADSAARVGQLGNEVPTAPTWDEISQLGEISPLGPPPAMPEAPQLPNPMDMARPDAVDFVSPPPISDVVDAPPGPAEYTMQDVERDLQAWIQANPGVRATQVHAKRAELLAKVGTQNYDHFSVDVSPVAPTDTSVDLPPPPVGVQGEGGLYGEEDFARDVTAWVEAHPNYNSADLTAYRATLFAKMGQPKQQTDYMPDVSPFPDIVPAAPDIANIAPGPNTPPAPTGGSGVGSNPPSSSTPNPSSPVGGGAPPVTQPPPPPPVGTTPGSGINYQPTIPPSMQDSGNALWDTMQDWRNRNNRNDMGGIEQVVTNPVTAYDDVTGEPVFTMTEPTEEFPGGIPETAEVSPDGSTVDIQPFGQDKESAIKGIFDDGHKRLRSGEAPQDVFAFMQEAFSAVMRNSRQERPDIRTAYAQEKAAQDYPGIRGTADVSPAGTPAPDFVAGLMGDAKTVMQGKKKLREVAQMARR